MIIEHIKLKNFRQYKDEKLLFAKPEKGKNFTIIQASNGVGKSNLFNAINWCLYNKEIYLTKEEKRLPLVNTLTLMEKPTDKDTIVEVEMKMRDDENKIMVITRKQCFYTNDDEIIKDPSELEMMREINKNMMKISSPEYIISQYIPESIKEYFFFDGERLDDYFMKEGADSIKKAVFKISQIELLDKLISHLEDKSNDFLKENKNLSPAAENIRLEIDSVNKTLETLKKDLEFKTGSLQEARKHIKEMMDKIKNNPVPNSEELKGQRIHIEEDLNKIEGNIKEIDSELEEYFMDITPKILIYDAIKNLQEQIEEKKKKKEIPPGITDNYIKQLLKSGKCICGREICNKDHSKECITELLNIYNKLSNIGNELLNNQSNIEIILKEVSKFKDKYLSYEKKKKELQKEHEEKSKLLKKVKDKLALTDESYARYEQQLELFETEKENAIIDITRLNTDIENAQNFVKAKKEDLDTELKKQTKFNLLRNKLKFCKDSLDAAKKIKEEIVTETKMEIESKTKKQFFELIWNSESFEDVKIDDNYNLSVIHKSGLESIGSLSAGQREILALSFIAALNSISGFNLPIIIDTPLGRISGDNRLNIAEKLPKFLENKQVTLLVTDEEYTPEIRKKLQKHVGKEYEIKLKNFECGGIANITEK